MGILHLGTSRCVQPVVHGLHESWDICTLHVVQHICRCQHHATMSKDWTPLQSMLFVWISLWFWLGECSWRNGFPSWLVSHYSLSLSLSLKPPVSSLIKSGNLLEQAMLILAIQSVLDCLWESTRRTLPWRRAEKQVPVTLPDWFRLQGQWTCFEYSGFHFEDIQRNNGEGEGKLF